MTHTHTKRWALGALVVSVLCIAWAIVTTVSTAPVLGPMALVAMPGDELWLDVDGERWRAAADGHLIERRRWDALGLPGAPANLLRHPDGGLVATVRRDSTLYRLDPQSGQVQGRLQPRWAGRTAGTRRSRHQPCLPPRRALCSGHRGWPCRGAV